MQVPDRRILCTEQSYGVTHVPVKFALGIGGVDNVGARRDESIIWLRVIPALWRLTRNAGTMSSEGGSVVAVREQSG